MSDAVPIPPPGFNQLTIDEQVEYVAALWNYVTSSTDRATIPEWHRELISERMTRYGSNVNGRTWEEFEKELIKS